MWPEIKLLRTGKRPCKSSAFSLGKFGNMENIPCREGWTGKVGTAGDGLGLGKAGEAPGAPKHLAQAQTGLKTQSRAGKKPQFGLKLVN